MLLLIYFLLVVEMHSCLYLFIHASIDLFIYLLVYFICLHSLHFYLFVLQLNYNLSLKIFIWSDLFKDVSCFYQRRCNSRAESNPNISRVAQDPTVAFLTFDPTTLWSFIPEAKTTHQRIPSLISAIIICLQTDLTDSPQGNDSKKNK